MIKALEPITMAQVKQLLKEAKTEKAVAVAQFLNQFVKLSPEQAAQLLTKLKGLELVKLKEIDLVKLVDFLPQDAEDVRKIFAGTEVSLSQDEIDKILQALK